MTASEKSFLGLAQQTASGTPNTTDADFMYMLYTQGGGAVNNVFRPLDMEVGGGALPRGVVKAGVVSGAAAEIIPRPSTLGHYLYGALGNYGTPTDNADGSYTHTFTLPTDEFDAPYYAIRNAPGDIWGEQYQDCRVSALALRWRGADFVRGSVGFQGGLPAVVSTATWSASTYVDGGPQFLAPLGDIELPTATDIKVLEGSFVAGMAIPLDEQWIVGSYVPDDQDIVARTFALTMRIKVTSASLYTKMAYDPAEGSAWTADVFREGDIKLYFASDVDAGSTPTPYSLNIAANGQSGANSNLIWTVQPLSMRAGGVVTMIVSAAFNADPSGSYEPITVELTNTVADYDA